MILYTIIDLLASWKYRNQVQCFCTCQMRAVIQILVKCVDIYHGKQVLHCYVCIVIEVFLLSVFFVDYLKLVLWIVYNGFSWTNLRVQSAMWNALSQRSLAKLAMLLVLLLMMEMKKLFSFKEIVLSFLPGYR